MVHEYSLISQNNPLWKGKILGDPQKSTITLGQAGCYVSSFAVLASYYGHSITPDQMNSELLSRNLFAQGNLMSNDNDLQDVFPDIKYTISYYFPNKPPTPANLGLLRDLMSDPANSVIVCIDLHNGTVHFTPVVDCDGTNVTIMNVWDGVVRDFKSVYGDPATNIIRFIVYKGNVAPAEPSQQDLIDELRHQRDHNNNLTVALLDRLNLHPTDEFPVDVQVEKAGEQIDIMRNKITILETRLRLIDGSEEGGSDDQALPSPKQTGKKKGGKTVKKTDSVVTVTKTTVLDGILSLLRKGGIIE